MSNLPQVDFIKIFAEYFLIREDTLIPIDIILRFLFSFDVNSMKSVLC